MGNPVAIAVSAGRARFQVDQRGQRAPTLVIVSSLAREAGPFPIRLTAKGVTVPEPIATVDDRPNRLVKARVSPLDAVPVPTSSPPAAERTFHLLVRDGDVASASNYLPVRASLRATGQRVQVYVDNQDSGRVGSEVLRDLVATFDGRIFPVAAKTIGIARDADGDGRFTVLMSSWLTRLAGGRLSVDGFVRGADLDADLKAPFSNHCDMMYLSATLEAGPHLRTVLAHEYTHAVTCTAKSFTSSKGEGIALDEEGWLDEGLAHLGEDLHRFSRSNIDYRISAFLSRPERYRLVVDDYYTADLFRSHGNRGGTYLFLRWCADRFGQGLLPTLVRSNCRGTENLEAATGLSFAALYRQWSIALFLSGLDPAHPSDRAFRSIDLRSPIGGWELAGPRTLHVAPGSGAETWTTAGTSSRYVVVEPLSEAQVEIEVEAPQDAELQVTALPLPADLARLNLVVRTTTSPRGTVHVHASLAELRGTPVRLSAMAWEPLAPAAEPRACRFRHGGLDHDAIASAFGADTVPPRGVLHSQSIHLDGVAPGDGPVVIKVQGVDPLGRRVAAWAEINPGSTRDSAEVED